MALSLAVFVLVTAAVAVDGVYVSGQFSTAGGTAANNVARWNGTAWAPLGTGTNAIVEPLAWYQGRLIAGGDFTTAGGVTARRIAAWTPATAQWQALGGGATLNGAVTALLVVDDVLYIGGWFTTSAPITAGLACYNGTTETWSSPGTGISNGGGVFALGKFNSAVIAGGMFTSIDGVAASNIAQLSGGRWSALGSGITGTPGQVYDFATYAGHLFVGGLFTAAGGLTVCGIAVWTGTVWSTVGSGVSSGGDVNAFAVLGNLLYVGGFFSTMNGITASNIAVYSQTGWAYVPGADDRLYALLASTDADGALYAAGAFNNIADVPALKVAASRGTSGWSALSTGVTGFLRALADDAPPASPTPPPPTTSPPPVNCPLDGVEWRAQYYYNTSVLVEDHLTFQENDQSFAQNVTAFPFQTCASNWIYWDGTYDRVSTTTLQMAYIRCTPSTPGCVSCEPTRFEVVGISFSADCKAMILKLPDGEVHSYFAARAA